MTALSAIAGHLRAAANRVLGERIHDLRVPGVRPPLHLCVHAGKDAVISRDIRESGIWEPDETAFLLDQVKPGATVADVGANIGYFTVIAAHLAGPGGKVFAFEPEQKNLRLLEKNIRLNELQNVTIYPLALSDRGGSTKLFLSAENMGDHQLFPGGEGEGRATSEIATSRGDDVVPPSETLSFLKIDTQGAEYHVIKGLAATIRRSLPDLVILLEFTPNALKAAGKRGADLLELLMSFDLDFYLLAHQALIPFGVPELDKWIRVTEMDPHSIGFTNIVCVSRKRGTGLGSERLPICHDDPLEILLGNPLEPWDGKTCDITDRGKLLLTKNGWDLGFGIVDETASLYFKPALPAAAATIRLKVEGEYEGEAVPLSVSVGGNDCGAFDLSRADVEVPAELFTPEGTLVEFAYPPGADRRQSVFRLRSIAWTADRSPASQ